MVRWYQQRRANQKIQQLKQQHLILIRQAQRQFRQNKQIQVYNRQDKLHQQAQRRKGVRVAHPNSCVIIDYVLAAFLYLR